MSKGYHYIAYGLPYVKEALTSAASLKKVMPDARISISTDQIKAVKSAALFDVVSAVDAGERKGSFATKINGLLRTPYDYTLYVDTDTYFVRSCDHLFSLLDRYDLCAAVDPEEPEIPSLKGRAVFNTGVMLYHRKRVTPLFNHWHSIYNYEPKWDDLKQHHPGQKVNDQPYLTFALDAFPRVRCLTLPACYNYRLTHKTFSCRGDIYILHAHLTEDQFVFKHTKLVSGKTYVQSKSVRG